MAEAMDQSDVICVDFDEEDLCTSNSNNVDAEFDMVIGHIEDIMMEEKFQSMHDNFLQKVYHEFDDTEENKFIYTDIHKEYINLVEKCLEEELCARIQNFSMVEFTKKVIERKSELDGEIFEMLLTFSDFMSFKEMVLDYKASKEGKVEDLSLGITITPVDMSLQGDFS